MQDGHVRPPAAPHDAMASPEAGPTPLNGARHGPPAPLPERTQRGFVPDACTQGAGARRLVRRLRAAVCLLSRPTAHIRQPACRAHAWTNWARSRGGRSPARWTWSTERRQGWAPSLSKVPARILHLCLGVDCLWFWCLRGRGGGWCVQLFGTGLGRRRCKCLFGG